MHPPALKRSALVPRVFKNLWFAALALLLFSPLARAANPDIFPLSQVRPGMHGTALTIFEGDQVEKMDLVVIGIMPNFLGPKESIILVQLMGPKVEHSGVVAGMSGSPVYFDGKLAGAISLKLGQFSKEPLAGVTPIENMLNFSAAPTSAPVTTAQTSGDLAPQAAAAGNAARLNLPPALSSNAGLLGGAFLTPIDSPLVFSGFNAQAIRAFSSQFAAYGMVAAQGGTGDVRPDDADIKPGDMVSAVLLEGDLSINASCTVTAIVNGRVYVCGHTLFGFGPIEMPMARGRVLTTLNSDLESSKIVNVGGTIGSFKQDRVSAVVGSLGAAPKMIPIDMTVHTSAGDNHLQFRMMSNPKITPVLMGLSVLQGLTQNSVYDEGTTLKLTAGIQIAGHPSVDMETLFPSSDNFIPDGTSVAQNVQSVFQRIFSNPYETANIEKVTLSLEALPDTRQTIIEGAWPDKMDVAPGDTVDVKVQLRPYRGAPFIRDVRVAVPPQAMRGTTMQILASDSSTLNRMNVVSGAQGRLQSLDQLISVLNRERRNDRLYVTLLDASPTMVTQDKIMPDLPASQINLLGQRIGPANSVVARESAAGEWSVPLDQVVQGSVTITVHIK